VRSRLSQVQRDVGCRIFVRIVRAWGFLSVAALLPLALGHPQDAPDDTVAITAITTRTPVVLHSGGTLALAWHAGRLGREPGARDWPDTVWVARGRTGTWSKRPILTGPGALSQTPGLASFGSDTLLVLLPLFCGFQYAPQMVVAGVVDPGGLVNLDTLDDYRNDPRMFFYDDENQWGLASLGEFAVSFWQVASPYPEVRYSVYRNGAWSTPSAVSEFFSYPGFAEAPHASADERASAIRMVVNGRRAPYDHYPYSYVFLLTLPSDGREWSDPALVTWRHARNAPRNERVCVARSGTIYVFWTEKAQDVPPTANRIYFSYSLDGTHWSEPTLLASQKLRMLHFVSVQPGVDDAVHVVWGSFQWGQEKSDQAFHCSVRRDFVSAFDTLVHAGSRTYLAGAVVTPDDTLHLFLLADVDGSEANPLKALVHRRIYLASEASRATAPTGPTQPGPPLMFRILPNPSRGEFQIIVRGQITEAFRVTVFDLRGRVVRVVEGRAPASEGGWLLRWDGRDSRGLPAADGLYLFRLETPHFAATRKAILLR